MVGWIVFALIAVIEACMLGYSILQKKNIKRERAIIRVGVFFIAVFAVIAGIIKWNFSVIGLYVVLLLLTIYSAVVLIKHARGVLKVKDYTKGRSIRHTIGMILLLGFSVIPMLLFPQHKDLETTGQYESNRMKYTWTDESRQETFSDKQEARNVTVEFYYPSEYKDGTELAADETFPLIVFSHGAFGYIESNYSLFKELASNGYIVCSISHTYHAFFTEETDGSIKLGDMNFIQEIMNASYDKYENEEQQELDHKWMTVRTGDMNFVLDTIEQMVKDNSTDAVFEHMTLDSIGLIGHSLGGATSLQVARERDNIGAVIVLDATHVGERTCNENGEWVYNETPLNVPILDLRNEVLSNSINQRTDEYVNDHTLRVASVGKAVTILRTGHLNFTDLPMFSPSLSKILGNAMGSGTCDTAKCMEQIDSIVLQWFNYYIKGDSVLNIQDVYDID